MKTAYYKSFKTKEKIYQNLVSVACEIRDNVHSSLR